MIGQVRDLLAQGYTDDQVLAYFESAYGEFVRLSPRADGANLLVWFGPVVVLALGIGVLFLRRRSDRPATSPSPEETVEEGLDDYIARVRAESGADE